MRNTPAKDLERPLSTKRHPGPLPPFNKNWATESLVRNTYFDGSSDAKPFSEEIVLTLQMKGGCHRIIVSIKDEIGEKIALQLGGRKKQEPCRDIKTLADKLRSLHLPPINQRQLAHEITCFREKIGELLWQTASDVAFMDL